MTASIKRAIRPTMMRLKKYLEELSNVTVGKPMEDEDKELYKRKAAFIKETLNQLESATKYLVRQNQKWLHLIENPNNRKSDREEAYLEMQIDEENGLTLILYQASAFDPLILLTVSFRTYNEKVKGALDKLRSRKSQAASPYQKRQNLLQIN